MKLFVTLGTTAGPVEQTFDIPEGMYVTYLGLEIESNPRDDRIPEDRITGYESIDRVNGSRIPERSGRLTIVRMPFSRHGGSHIHTVCRLYENGEVGVIPFET